MLVIARKTGESVQIGEEIEVKVVRTGRFRVTIAIAAPRELKILRTKGADPTADNTGRNPIGIKRR